MQKIFKTNLKAIVKLDYIAAYDAPVIIGEGEEIIPIKKDEEFEGWVWCNNLRGEGGWIPEKYIFRQDTLYRSLYDYSSKELTIKKGESLHLSDFESGWYWAKNENGECGWVPAKNLEIFG